MMPDYENNLIESFSYKPPNTKTFKIDWENDRLLSRKIDKLDAIDQAIDVYMAVEYQSSDIMPDWFGMEKTNLVGKPANFIQANIERLIKEAISPDERILKMTDFNSRMEGDNLIVSFNLDTTEGKLSKEMKWNIQDDQ